MGFDGIYSNGIERMIHRDFHECPPWDLKRDPNMKKKHPLRNTIEIVVGDFHISGMEIGDVTQS